MKEFLQFDKFLVLFENNTKLKKKFEDEWSKQLEIVTKINFNDYFFVPQCIALVSKYPYVNQMQDSLESILKVSSTTRESSSSFMANLLQLIKGVPIPTIKKNVSFYVPYKDVSINLTPVLPVNKDLPLTNFNSNRLLDILNIDMIIQIFHLIQLEQKILFVGNDYNQISEIIDLFSNLIYPLE